MTLQSDKLYGTYTAIVTPFTGDTERIDEQSMARLISRQLAAGINGIVVCGSTGESPCLSPAEYEQMIGRSRELIAGHVPIVAGISQSSTARAVELGRIAKKAGADGLLIAAPPYNKPSQEGIYQHTLAVFRASGLPIIAYNIPCRSGVNIEAATIARMATDGFVVGAKDSTGTLESVLELLAIAPSGVRVFAGEDHLVWPVMSCGGIGTISASANVVPEIFVALTDAAQAGNIEKARHLQLELLPIIRLLFMETNPVAMKAALWLQGVIESPSVRLPLLRASETTIASIKEVLKL
jgi:4-hydroxy-tetrahydrodipicolinate synthase